MQSMTDFSRQSNIFKPEEFNTPIHIIGAGATGSWVALLLAKLGIKDITVYDFDSVEEHNLPNQFFSTEDTGDLKIAALAMNVQEYTGTLIQSRNTKVDGSTKLSGIVFVLTDTMASRKEIWEKALRLNFAVKMVVETRMGLRDGRLYAINPNNFTQVQEYDKMFYSDEESEVSGCGTSQSMAPTAAFIAARAVWKVIKLHNGKPIDNEMIIDIENNNELRRKFSETWDY